MLRPPGFRLPEATRPGVVRLQVTDLARSLEYYTRVVGLRVLDEASSVATLGAPDGRRLVTLDAPGGVQASRRGAIGLFHFAILLPTRKALGQFVSHLRQSRIRFSASDHLVSEALYLWDPDGLGIEVYADRPRDTWQSRNGELAMATEPLDLGSLVTAAAGSTWDGAPARTTMGHVHLHVGDLQAADDFYHRALGFDRTVWSYPGALFMAAGGYHHHVAVNTWSHEPAAREDEARLVHWELAMPDTAAVAAAAASLRAGGYQVTAAGEETIAADPWGTTVRLIGDDQYDGSPDRQMLLQELIHPVERVDPS